MGKVTEVADIRVIKDIGDIARFVSLQFKALLQVINGNLSFQDNIRCITIPVDFNTANSDLTIDHGLGFVPSGFLVVSKPVALDVYLGSVAATKNNLTLKSTVAASGVKILIF